MAAHHAARIIEQARRPQAFAVDGFGRGSIWSNRAQGLRAAEMLLRELGDDAFRQGHFEEAEVFYSAADAAASDSLTFESLAGHPGENEQPAPDNWNLGPRNATYSNPIEDGQPTLAPDWSPGSFNEPRAWDDLDIYDQQPPPGLFPSGELSPNKRSASVTVPLPLIPLGAEHGLIARLPSYLKRGGPASGLASAGFADALFPLLETASSLPAGWNLARNGTVATMADMRPAVFAGQLAA